MKNKGFTLVETMISLVILGIVCITVISLINTISMMMTKNNRNYEMLSIGGMVMENIRAYNPANEKDLFIIDTNVKDIIETFNRERDSSLDFSSKSQYRDEYNINICKETRSEKLWKICVTVSYDKGENHNEIKYRAIIPQK